MLTIKRYHTLEDAELGRSLLESNGIPATIPNASTQTNLPFLSMIKSGVCLMVDDKDAEAACQLLGVDQIPESVTDGPNWMLVFFLLVAGLVGFAIWSANR